MSDWLEKEGWRVERDEKGMDFIQEELGVTIRCEGSELPWEDLSFTNHISSKTQFEIARRYFDDGLDNLDNSEVGICLTGLLADFVEFFLYERLASKTIKFKWDIEVEETGTVTFTHKGDVVIADLVDNLLIQMPGSDEEIVKKDVEVIERLFYRFVGDEWK